MRKHLLAIVTASVVIAVPVMAQMYSSVNTACMQQAYAHKGASYVDAYKAFDAAIIQALSTRTDQEVQAWAIADPRYRVAALQSASFSFDQAYAFASRQLWSTKTAALIQFQTDIRACQSGGVTACGGPAPWCGSCSAICSSGGWQCSCGISSSAPPTDSCRCPSGQAWNAQTGQCTPQGGYACPMVYSPVCGCDGKTYSNSCTANQVGVKQWSGGSCGGGVSSSPAPCPVVEHAMPPPGCQYVCPIGPNGCPDCKLVCTSSSSKSCATQGTCRYGEICPAGTSCSGMPAYGCYPTGCPTPICLAETTRIATPQGNLLVTELRVGSLVWTLTNDGKKVARPLVQVGRTLVPSTHKVVHLVLADGRSVLVSPGHPTADGRTVGSLKAGQMYDGSTIKEAALVHYQGKATYDLLPDSVTGVYWADGILLGSTLRH